MFKSKFTDYCPDVFFIGYPKAASTFIFHYLQDHPQVHVDHRAGALVFKDYPPEISPEEGRALTHKKTYVSQDEKIVLSFFPKRSHPYKGFMFDPDAVDRMDEVIDFSPRRVAETILSRCPQTKILICIRDQASWLESAYRYFISEMPAGKREFADFLKTPRGQLMQKIAHYDDIIATYIDVFGEDRVEVVEVDELKRSPKIFIQRLCSFIGVDLHEEVPPPANVGRTDQITAVHKYGLNKIPMPNILKQIGRKIIGSLPRSAFESVGLTEQEKRDIRERYSKSNMRTAQLIEKLRERDQPS